MPTQPRIGPGREGSVASSDVLVLVLGGALACLWDFCGGDLAVARWFGQAAGFPLREALLTAHVMHDGGRWLAWSVAGAWAFYATCRAWPGPSQRERLLWLVVAVASLLVVSGVKSVSLTSCPWDLAEFGGRAKQVSHWAWGVADGGAGRCFPSGHASAAFCFFAGHFLLRRSNPRGARAVLCLAGAAGVLFGGAQVARGAHFVSHVFWSAWMCWAVCAGASLAMRAWPFDGARRSSFDLHHKPVAGNAHAVDVFPDH